MDQETMYYANPQVSDTEVREGGFDAYGIWETLRIRGGCSLRELQNLSPSPVYNLVEYCIEQGWLLINVDMSPEAIACRQAYAEHEGDPLFE